MPGPVFERELTTTARSGRAFALRSTYGLALLAVVVATYRNACGTDLDPGPTQVTRLAGDLFRNLVLAQGVAVVLLTPALVAGAIAGEAQRKTLHDLLTTELTAAEIVLGKLAARLLHVGVLVAAGLPFLLLAGLLGGVDPRLVVLSVAATLTTAFFLGGPLDPRLDPGPDRPGGHEPRLHPGADLADPARRRRLPPAPLRAGRPATPRVGRAGQRLGRADQPLLAPAGVARPAASGRRGPGPARSSAWPASRCSTGRP